MPLPEAGGRRRPGLRPGAAIVCPVTGLGEVGRAMTAALAGPATDGTRPRSADGDVVVVTQKIVSKAEGRLVPIDADDPPPRSAWSSPSRSGSSGAGASR